MLCFRISLSRVLLMASSDEFDISRSRTFLSRLALAASSLTDRGGSFFDGDETEASSVGEGKQAMAASIGLLDIAIGGSKFS
jgi:hypothetical protein